MPETAALAVMEMAKAILKHHGAARAVTPEGHAIAPVVREMLEKDGFDAAALDETFDAAWELALQTFVQSFVGSSNTGETEPGAAPSAGPGTVDAALLPPGFEWAIVEIFGHRRHVGRCTEVERFGTQMLRIDVPTLPPTPTLFDAADGKPPTPLVVWATFFYGGASIFSYVPTDEDTAIRSNRASPPPTPYRLPHHHSIEPDDDGCDDDDRPF